MTRALLAAGVLLAFTPMAEAGDRGAFDSQTPVERVDITPLSKTAPEPEAARTIAAAAPAATPEKAEAKGPHRRKTRLARHAAEAVATAALKATFPTTPAGTGPAAKPPVGEAVATVDPKATTEAAGSAVEPAAPTPPAIPAAGGPREAASGSVADLLARHARANGVPLKLAQAVVTIESRGNARASNAGALGLMQIKYGTARAAGFGGPAVGLFTADTNLRFGMKILGDAYRAAGGDTCGALMRYQSGHLATHMSRANRVYCTRARAIMAGA